MKKTLYEILEVSEGASKEVIEKAYKVLAKKYHPDLQTPENKQMAEQKMKQINEAYGILSDDTKRASYDKELKSKREEEKRQELAKQQVNQNSINNQVYYANNATYTSSQNQNNSNNNQTMSEAERRYREKQRRKYEEDLRKQQEQMRKNLQQNCENAYYNYLRSLGYRIKEKWTWRKTIKLIVGLLIFSFIIWILWLIPVTHDVLLELYEGNALIKLIVDIVIAFFTAIVTAFQSLFKGW